MHITSLSLGNFRSYRAATIAPSSGTNLILGDNAQGKTNLVEAICYLSTARSFRGAKESELLKLGETDALCEATLQSDREYKISVRFGTKREIFINSVKKRRTSELLGVLQTVLFCPEDLSLIRDGAAARRKFMDTALCQLRPGYAVLLGEYTRLLQHKNRILKDAVEYPSLLDTLDDFSARLCQTAAALIPYRVWFLDALSHYAAAIHCDISGGKEALGLAYKTVSTVEDVHAPAADLYEQVWRHYVGHKSAEIASKQCLTGIHKDDIDITINALSARTYASQGQTRSAALSLKLGQRDLMRADSGHCPVLILDDVLSELDESRRSYILKGIHEGQVFITACEGNHALPEGKIFTVRDGEIEG